MSVFSKLKGIFYDEVEEDETEDLSKIEKSIKKETKKVEVEEEKPKVEEIKYKTVDIEPEKEKVELPKTDNTFSERDLFRNERTFDFIEFDDDEETKKEEELPKRNVLSENNRTTRVESTAIPDTPKVFKPSPVISPIYGILDKDYKKEEIKTKPTNKDILTASVTTYDTVRRKAYGTLEDELEDTLNSMNKLSTNTIKEEINKVDRDVDLLEQKTSKIEDLITKIEEETTKADEEATVGDLEDKLELENFEEEEKTVSDNTLEHDLFNLIDSMYDDKEI